MNRLFLLVVSAFFTSGAFAQEAQEQILFANVHVFDGVSEMRIENANVLITDNLISAISTDPIVTDGATVIDGAGRTLMPGIIDSHIHLIVGYISAPDILTELPGYLTIRSTLAAEQVLDQGITTVRELGGESFTLKRAIDEGLMPGPRIFPSGAFITQTSGHFDFRSINSNNPSLTGSVPEFTLNQVYIVDSPDAVRAASRENLRRGASQLKLAIGGACRRPLIQSIQPSSHWKKLRRPLAQRKTGAPTSPYMATRTGPSIRPLMRVSNQSSMVSC